MLRRNAIEVTHLLERLEHLERHCGITFSGLYAEKSEYELVVQGEVKTLEESSSLPNGHLIICAVLYNEKGQVLDKDETYLSLSPTINFEVFQLRFHPSSTSSIAKIKLYPKTED